MLDRGPEADHGGATSTTRDETSGPTGSNAPEGSRLATRAGRWSEAGDGGIRLRARRRGAAERPPGPRPARAPTRGARRPRRARGVARREPHLVLPRGRRARGGAGVGGAARRPPLALLRRALPRPRADPPARLRHDPLGARGRGGARAPRRRARVRGDHGERRRRRRPARGAARGRPGPRGDAGGGRARPRATAAGGRRGLPEVRGPRASPGEADAPARPVVMDATVPAGRRLPLRVRAAPRRGPRPRRGHLLLRHRPPRPRGAARASPRLRAREGALSRSRSSARRRASCPCPGRARCRAPSTRPSSPATPAGSSTR